MGNFQELPKTKEGYKVKLDVFSGPLELLLHLIKIQEIDIYDIPVFQITEQYLEYLKIMQELDLDVAGEFLVMAATLMHIKSRMLLPKELSPEEEETGDPREELFRALIEYKRYKQASIHLAELATQRQEIFDRGRPLLAEEEDQNLVEADLFGLITAFRKVLDGIGEESFREIKRSTVTVKDKIKVLEDLFKERKELLFQELFEDVCSRVEAVVSFLAILELIKQGVILVRQKSIFGEIKLTKREK